MDEIRDGSNTHAVKVEWLWADVVQPQGLGLSLFVRSLSDFPTDFPSSPPPPHTDKTLLPSIPRRDAINQSDLIQLLLQQQIK